MVHFTVSIALNSQDAFTYSYLGEAYKKNKMYEEAVLELKKAIALDPNNAFFHLKLASIYRKKGASKEAKKEYERVLEILPHNKQIKETITELINTLNLALKK